MNPSSVPPLDAPALALRLADDGSIPNNPRLPLVLWRRVVDPGDPDPAARLEAIFARHGWVPTWRDGIYPFPHYHSTAHEVLGIASGRARVRLGGASGVELVVAAGDVVFLPAGLGHQRLEPAPGLLVVGAYPPGQRPDLCRGLSEERASALARIATLPDPPDPVRGGPLSFDDPRGVARSDR